MKYKKAFHSIFNRNLSWYHVQVCLLGLRCVCVCVCVWGGGGERGRGAAGGIKHLSPRTIFARVGALINSCLSEHDGEHTCAFTQCSQLKHRFPPRKYFILPHLSDPSCPNVFLRCLVHSIFVFLVIFLYSYFKFLQN